MNYTHTRIHKASLAKLSAVSKILRISGVSVLTILIDREMYRLTKLQAKCKHLNFDEYFDRCNDCGTG